MVHTSPGGWLLGRLRTLTRRGFDFDDLVDAIQFRDFMLGTAMAPASDERQWFGLETEAKALEFAQRLARGDGSGAPLGDKFALAIRLCREVRDFGASEAVIEALRAWLAVMRDRDLSEFSSLHAVIGVLDKQLSNHPS